MLIKLQSGLQNLGNATMIFTYDKSSLLFPNDPSAGSDYVFNNFQGNGYSSTVSKPVAGKILINIAYTFSNGGTPATETFIPVVTIKFKTLDTLGVSRLVWGEGEFFKPNSSSKWNLGSWLNENTPLPVELSSFSASVLNGKVVLKWTTASELNNRGFEVEKSSNNSGFVSVGFVPGSGTSAEENNYVFTISDADTGIQYYRLKQIDTDGSVKYSKIINIRVNIAPLKFNLAQNYPNPFNPSTTINYTLPVESSVIFILFNSIGEKIKELNEGTKQPGYYSFVWQPQDLSSGVYFYSMIGKSSDGKNNFRKTLKMLYLK
ncbi:MAG: hypothetical protein ACM339_01290 [Ignavibacteria bacterium]